MFSIKQYHLKNLNISLIVVVILLCLISSFALYLGRPGLFARQLFGLAIGVVVLVFLAVLDYHFISRFVIVYYMVVTALLVLTRFSPLGTDLATGCRRWINLRVVQIQPSELAKITLILILAVLFTWLEEKMDHVSTLVLAGMITAIPTLLIEIQTDLSSSVVMVFILVVMTFTAGLSYKIILTIVGITIPTILGFFWYIQQPGQKLLKAYQLERIIGFLNPEKYEQSTMYQQLNSVQAIGAGKLYGKLLSEGTSSVRGYNSVGVRESDFIWSIVGEEFGFLGCCLIILLLFVVIVMCLLVAKKAKDRLGRLIAIGISAMFMFQVFANIGVATMILPNTGLPLPFISYGLSSLVSAMIAVGIVLNIGLQQKNSVRGVIL